MESPIFETFPELDVDTKPRLIDLSHSVHSEVQNQFLAHQFETERERRLTRDYLKEQSELTEKMRKVVVDWMVQVQLRFRSSTRTLHLAVALMDRFLSVRQCPKGHLQKVAVASMLLANAYDETYSLDMCDYVYMTAKAISAESLSKTSEIMLAALNYKLLTPTILYFVNIYLGQLKKVKKHAKALTRYFAEQCLMNYKMLRQHPPSELAFACLYLANRWGKKKLNLRPVRRLTGYSGQHQRQCITKLEEFLRYACQPDSPYSAIPKKYAKTTNDFIFPAEI